MSKINRSCIIRFGTQRERDGFFTRMKDNELKGIPVYGCCICPRGTSEENAIRITNVSIWGLDNCSAKVEFLPLNAKIDRLIEENNGKFELVHTFFNGINNCGDKIDIKFDTGCVPDNRIISGIKKIPIFELPMHFENKIDKDIFIEDANDLIETTGAVYGEFLNARPERIRSTFINPLNICVRIIQVVNKDPNGNCVNLRFELFGGKDIDDFGKIEFLPRYAVGLDRNHLVGVDILLK